VKRPWQIISNLRESARFSISAHSFKCDIAVFFATIYAPSKVFVASTIDRFPQQKADRAALRKKNHLPIPLI
jgi:hypothetical protein